MIEHVLSKGCYLSQELAVKKSDNSNNFLSVLNDLAVIVDVVIPHEAGYLPDSILQTLEREKERFSKDYERVGDLLELLFGDEVVAYGDRCTAVFERWEKEGGGPSSLALIAHAWEFFGLPQGDALEQCAVISAVLAEIPNVMQYHGNEHYRKVLFHTIRMLVSHDKLQEEDRLRFDQADKALLMIAAMIHDLGHEGGDNLREGIYTPGYMEQKSIDMVMPYYEHLGMDRDLSSVLQTLVFCTDITFFAGDNSPCVRMRRIYDYYIDNKGDESVENYMIGKLRLFYENPKLAMMAMMLHEADIATSAGLSYEQSIKETIDIMEERCLKNASPGILLAFLQQQLEGHMKTQAAQTLFGSAMDMIISRATQELQGGRTSFYEDYDG